MNVPLHLHSQVWLCARNLHRRVHQICSRQWRKRAPAFFRSIFCLWSFTDRNRQVRVVKIQVVKFWVTQPFCFFNIKKDLITFDCIALQIGSNIFFCIFYLWSFRDKMQRQKYVEDFGILILSRLDRRNSGENLVQIFICLIFIYFLKIF